MPDIEINEKLISFLMFLPLFFLSLAVHEYSHAYLAEKFGDDTAKRLGRLTLNPIRHIDLVGSIIMPLLSFASGFMLIGWAKPVPVNRNNLRNQLRDDALVSAAGPLSNLLLAVMFFLLILLMHQMNFTGSSGSDKVFNLLNLGMYFNIFLFLFNLLPIPPLDGSHILYDIFPNRLTAGLLNTGIYGFFILMLFIYSPLWAYFVKVINSIYTFFFHITGMI